MVSISPQMIVKNKNNQIKTIAINEVLLPDKVDRLLNYQLIKVQKLL